LPTPAASNWSGWTNPIGSISLFAPNANVLEKEDTSYRYELASNSKGISLSPQRGQLAPGQTNTVSVLASAAVLLLDKIGGLGWDRSSLTTSVSEVRGVTIITTLPTKIMQDQSFAINVSIRTTPSTTSSSDQREEPVTANIIKKKHKRDDVAHPRPQVTSVANQEKKRRRRH